MSKSPLLELCQELRDIIFEYALLEDERLDSSSQWPLGDQQDLRTVDVGPDEWKFQCQTLPPNLTWLNLTRTNRQLRHETKDSLNRKRHKASNNVTAKATLHLKHPLCTVVWDSLPGPPEQTQSLDLQIKIDNFYAKAIQPPSNALFHALQQTVERYLTYGPHLVRTAPLKQPLQLDKVRVTFALPTGEMASCVYGNPWLQLQNLYLGVKASVQARAWKHPSVRAVEMRVEGRAFERVGCTKGFELEGENGNRLLIEPGQEMSVHAI